MPTQDFTLPPASETYANSRSDWNDALSALRADFEGPSAPSSPVAYMRWADTTNMLLKQRDSTNSSWVTIGKLDVAHWGLVSLDTPGQAFAVDVSMGGNTLDNLGMGGALSAARNQEVDLKAPIAAPSFTGDATINQDPAGATSIVRRSWAESTFLPLAGGALTGRTSSPSSPAAAAADLLRKDEVEGLNSFDTSSGHNHDGVNSRKIDPSDIDLFNIADGRTQVYSTSGNSGGWVTVTLSSHTTPDTARIAWLTLHSFRTGTSLGRLDQYILVRKTGTTPGDQHRYQMSFYDNGAGGAQDQITIPIFIHLNGSQQFDILIDQSAASATNRVYLNGWMK